MRILSWIFLNGFKAKYPMQLLSLTKHNKQSLLYFVLALSIVSFLVCSLYILVFSAKISHFSGKVVSVVVDTAVYAYPEGLTYGMEIEHEGNRRYVKTPPVRGLQQSDGLMNLVGQEVYVTYWNTKNFYPKGKKSPQYMAQIYRCRWQVATETFDWTV